MLWWGYDGTTIQIYIIPLMLESQTLSQKVKNDVLSSLFSASSNPLSPFLLTWNYIFIVS